MSATSVPVSSGAGSKPSSALRARHQRVVDPYERQHDADREHRARQGVAERGETHGGAREAVGLEAVGVGEQQREEGRHRRRRRAEHQRIQEEPHIALVEVRIGHLPDPRQQLAQRHDEGEQQHHAREGARAPAAPAREPVTRFAPGPQAHVIARPATQALLGHERRGHEQQQQRGQLRGRGQREQSPARPCRWRW